MSNWRRVWLWGPVTMLWGAVSVALACTAIPLVSIFTGRPRALMLVGRVFARTNCWVGGVRFEREGWEDLPEDIRSGRQPAVFMGNHQSHLDVPLVISALEVPAVFIAKKELRWVPFLGWVIWFMGFVFINRQNRNKAIESLAQAARDIRAGKNVVIFPEGTRTRDGRLGDFKKGGFALAQEAGVPIVPMAMQGGFAVLPKGSWRVRPGRYHMVIGASVDTAAFASREDLVEEVRRRIEALYQRASA